MPPATTISCSPARISWSASAIALMPGQADLVDRDRGDVHRDAALDRGLAGGDLPGAGLDDLAHDHVVDLVAGDAGLLQRALDGDAAEVGGGLVLETAEQAADRGARTRDDDGSGHDASCVTSRHACGQARDASDDTHRVRRAGRGRRPPGVRNRSQSLARPRTARTTMCAMSRSAIPEHLFVAIDHVGVAVPDLDEAIAFYRDTFGMQVAHEETNEEQGVREAMVAVGDSGSCIQLLAPLDDESTIAKFLDRSGPGIQQLAYRVTDVEEVSRDPPRARRAAAVRRAAPRHLRLPDQLHPPEGRRRRAGRAGRARRSRALRRRSTSRPWSLER